MRWEHLFQRPHDTDYGVVVRDEVFAVHAARPAHTRGSRCCCHPDAVEISFLLSGMRHGVVADVEQTLQAGQYQYFPPGVPHSTENRAQGTVGIYVQLPLELFEDARAETGGELWTVSRPEVRSISSDLMGIINAFRRQTEAPEHDEMADALALYLAGYLIREHCRGSAVVALSPSGNEVRLARAVELMNSCFDQPLSLAQLARVSGLSRFRFAHAFKAKFGVSPYRYLERIRIRRASCLLRQRKRTVAEVAYAVGFPSSSRFSQVFRREFGVLPAAWRCETAA